MKSPISCTIEGCTPSLGSSSSSSVGAVDERAGDGQHLLLAARQRAAALARALAQEREPAIDLVERERCRAAALTNRPMRRLSMHRHMREDLAALRHVADAAPRPRGRRSRAVTSSPLKRICPLRAGSRPISVRISVLLPTPLRPSTPTTSPGATSTVDALQHVAGGIAGPQVAGVEGSPPCSGPPR